MDSQIQSLVEAYNQMYQLDEISLKTKINAYRNTQDYDADYAYGDKVYDQAGRILSNIEKKHGPKAAEHAERAGAVRMHGRADASGRQKELPKPRIEKSSYRTTKSGKMNKTDQNTLKRKLQNRRSQNEEFELIVDYLLDEGFVNNEVSAEVFIEHMSDEWIEYIIGSKNYNP
jgi:sRNA-binding protein